MIKNLSKVPNPGWKRARLKPVIISPHAELKVDGIKTKQ